MFEQFPYTDMHQLNLDWIVKIAKDFLEQYTHIQELIASGEESIQNLTSESLEALAGKAEELETLLQAWYDTHSQDIADQLTAAVTSFNNSADAKTLESIASIPADYTTLTRRVDRLDTLTGDSAYIFSSNSLTWIDGYVSNTGDENTTSTGFKHTVLTEKLDISTKKLLSISCPISYTTAFVSLYQDGVYVRNIDIPTESPYFLLPDDANELVVNLYFRQSTPIENMNTTLISLQRNPYKTINDVSAFINSKDGIVDLLSVNPLEMGSYSQSTGEKTNSTSLCRNSLPIYVPVGTKINLLPLKSGARNFHMFQYNEDGSFARFDSIDNIPLDGSQVFITKYPLIAFDFYVGADHLSIAKTYFKVTGHLKISAYAGKKLSILGDSLSTFNGVSDPNTAYYPAGDVEGSGLTYWGLVAGDMEMTLEQVNAYGGSTVAMSSYTPMCSDTRLAALGNPDVIILQGGTNDIYSNIASGTWQGTGSDIDTSKFIPAYTKCINYLQQNYPNALIIAIGPTLIGSARPDFRKYCTVENVDRITENEREVCRILGAKFIDTRDLVMNLGNIDGYTIDQLHWNYKLMHAVANAIEEEMNK